ncbi:MAG: hypothetical protein K5656_08860 [Lachnospiraceae bacterium]|nr:hypothetical protein [Lachnospiraceae bacterium]
MRVLTYSMSLNGEYSATLHSMRYIADAFSKSGDEFSEIIMAKDGKVTDEELTQMAEADLVVIATSMYHFFIASQAMEAMGKIGAYLKEKCPNKPVTCFMTSNYLMDPLVRQYVKSWATSYNLNYLNGYNMFMNDMLEDDKRNDAFAWFESVRLLASNETLKAEETVNVRIVLADDNPKTAELADQYKQAFESANSDVKLIKISEYDFAPCLGCQFCYTTRKCFMEDEFKKALNDVQQGADVIVTVGELNNGFYSEKYKRFCDRHVCFGRCPTDSDIITLYSYYEGSRYNADDESLLTVWGDAMCSFGGDILIGTVKGFDAKLVNTAIAAFNAGCGPYPDMYGVLLRRRFADLAKEIQNVEPLDYKYFSSKGYYEPIEKNNNIRGIHNMESAKMSVEMKSFAVRSYRSQVDSTYTKVKRRANKNEPVLDFIQDPPYAKEDVDSNKPKKKGFNLFGKKG